MNHDIIIKPLGAFALAITLISCSDDRSSENVSDEQPVVSEEQAAQQESEVAEPAGDSFESIANEIVAMMNEMVNTLSKAKDVDSANEAVKGLDILADEANKIAVKLETLGKPDEATVKVVNEKMLAAQEDMGQKMMAAMGGVMQNPEVATIMQEGMMKFAEKTAPMEKISKEYFGSPESE